MCFQIFVLISAMLLMGSHSQAYQYAPCSFERLLKSPLNNDYTREVHPTVALAQQSQIYTQPGSSLGEVYFRPTSNGPIAFFVDNKNSTLNEVDLKTADLAPGTYVIVMTLMDKDYEGRRQRWGLIVDFSKVDENKKIILLNRVSSFNYPGQMGGVPDINFYDSQNDVGLTCE